MPHPSAKKRKQRGKNGVTRDLNVAETNVSIHCYTSVPTQKLSKETKTVEHTGQQRERRQN